MNERSAQRGAQKLCFRGVGKEGLRDEMSEEEAGPDAFVAPCCEL